MDFYPRTGKVTYTVCDPAKQYHSVMYLGGHWYGIENLAMHIDDKDLKWYTIRQLKKAMFADVAGKWQGYEWVPLD